MKGLSADDTAELLSLLDEILDGPEEGKRPYVKVMQLKRELRKWLVDKGLKPKGKWTTR